MASTTSDRSFTTDTLLDLPRVLNYLPLAMGSYGTGSGTAAVGVGKAVSANSMQTVDCISSCMTLPADLLA